MKICFVTSADLRTDNLELEEDRYSRRVYEMLMNANSDHRLTSIMTNDDWLHRRAVDDGLTVLNWPFRPPRSRASWTYIRWIVSRSLDFFRSIVRDGALALSERYFNALREVDADVYVVCGVSVISAVTASVCQKSGRKMILILEDSDGIGPVVYAHSEEFLANGLSGNIAWQCIDAANQVLVRSEAAFERISEFHNRVAIWEAPFTRNQITWSGDGNSILWVGSAVRSANPELIIRFAKNLNEHVFVLALFPGILSLFQRLLRDRRINTEIIRSPSNTLLAALIDDAAVIVRTDDACIAWNTVLLRAAEAGCPIVSVYGSVKHAPEGACAFASQGNLGEFEFMLENSSFAKPIYKAPSFDDAAVDFFEYF